MATLWQTAFAGIPRFLSGTPASGDVDATRVNAGIDQLVDDSDPRLRLIGDYRRRLRPPMEHALVHIDDLVARIPGPMEVCAHAFSTDSLVTAFFANTDQLHRIYCDSRAVRSFFTTPENVDADECHALLCMTREEKNVFGVGLEGKHGQLRRDIPQTLVSFAHHQLLSPSPNEQSARHSLQHCLLQGLLKQAGSNLSGGIRQRRSLRSRLQQLHSHLRALSHQPTAHGTRETEQADTRRELDSIERQLASLDKQFGDINGHLKSLIQGLEQAPEAIRVEDCKLRISRTHVKLDPQDQHDGTLLELAEVHLGQEAPRVVSLTRYPRSEFTPSDPGNYSV